MAKRHARFQLGRASSKTFFADERDEYRSRRGRQNSAAIFPATDSARRHRRRPGTRVDGVFPRFSTLLSACPGRCVGENLHNPRKHWRGGNCTASCNGAAFCVQTALSRIPRFFFSFSPSRVPRRSNARSEFIRATKQISRDKKS